MLSSGQKIILGLVALIVIGLFGAIVFFGREASQQKSNIELSVWGVKDTAGHMQNILNEFTNYYKQFEGFKNVTIHVTYKELPVEHYEQVLLNALAEGRGPDIFYVHNTWLPKHQNKLYPLPDGFMTIDQYRSTFMPVAASDLIRDNRIYAMPLYVDSLALYYNTDHYQDARTPRSSPQATWQGLMQDAQALTIRNSEGDILRGGVALGTTETVAVAPDVFLATLLQYGGTLCDAQCTTVTINENVSGVSPAAEALQTFLTFGNPTNGSWDDEIVEENRALANATDAFAQGHVSVIVGYQEIYSEIQAKRNQNVSFAIAEFPQVQDPSLTESRDTLAQYWAPAVSAQSTNAFTAWQFIAYLTGRDAAAKYHTATGRPTARQDLISLHQSEPMTGIFATQAKYAKSLTAYDIDAFREVFREVVDEVVDGESNMSASLAALEDALKASLVLKNYNTAPRSLAEEESDSDSSE